MPLVAVQGDKQSHGNGDLVCSNNSKVFAGGKRIANYDSDALADLIPHSGDSVKPGTVSSKVFVLGTGVHRNGDSRRCGATTSATNQSKVFVG